MHAMTIRKIDDDMKQRLATRAASNKRSMEAEARSILISSVRILSIALSKSLSASVSIVALRSAVKVASSIMVAMVSSIRLSISGNSISRLL